MKKFLLTIAAIAACGIASAQSSETIYSIDFSAASSALSTTLGADNKTAVNVTSQEMEENAEVMISGKGTLNFTCRDTKKEVIAKGVKKINEVDVYADIYALKVQGSEPKFTLEVEGGFKKGDIVKVTAYLFNGDATKSAILKIKSKYYDTEEKAEKESTLSPVDGVDEKGNIIVSFNDLLTGEAKNSNKPNTFEYKISHDTDLINLYRNKGNTSNATNTFVTKIEVVRDASASAIKGINADAVPAGKAVKTVEDGKIIIIRDGAKYDMSGRKL